MKKASKKGPRTGINTTANKPEMEGLTLNRTDSIAPTAIENPLIALVWIEIIPDLNISPSELDWVREVIRKHVELHVIQISNWQSGVTEVVKNLQCDSDHAKHHLYIASGNRSDAIASFASGVHNLLPESEYQFILGQWWAGHKRTAPLPQRNRSYYWHGLYDGLLKEMGVLAKPTSQAESALVVSSNPDLRKMWSELLPKDAIQVVGLTDTLYLPEAIFRYIIVDGDTTEDCSSLVARLRRRYPQATLAVAWGFPEWSKTRQALELGADIVVGKPFRWDNFLNSLRSHSGHR